MPTVARRPVNLDNPKVIRTCSFGPLSAATSDAQRLAEATETAKVLLYDGRFKKSSIDVKKNNAVERKNSFEERTLKNSRRLLNHKPFRSISNLVTRLSSPSRE
ncbi:hypothetical protein CSAL01_12696 [Colletotrichum salicis]|uniref:Uncharacterized protein n=1 Tax=Colletotrichum salicis TaxID=1209931 RepID=A0A135SP05_9PEZI|nr:hypothetical protein CSAL01_12696 [Colletotrichum salicis]